MGVPVRVFNHGVIMMPMGQSVGTGSLSTRAEQRGGKEGKDRMAGGRPVAGGRWIHDIQE